MLKSDLTVNASVIAYLDQAFAAREHNDPWPAPSKGLRDKACDLATYCQKMQRATARATPVTEYYEALKHVYEAVVRVIDSDGAGGGWGGDQGPT